MSKKTFSKSEFMTNLMIAFDEFYYYSLNYAFIVTDWADKLLSSVLANNFLLEHLSHFLIYWDLLILYFL